MITLNTTREERATALSGAFQRDPTKLMTNLASDCETLLSALVAEKRAHADTVRLHHRGASSEEAARLRADADALERLR